MRDPKNPCPRPFVHDKRIHALRTLASVTALALLGTASSALAQPSFRGLGTSWTGDYQTLQTSIELSADGQTVACTEPLDTHHVRAFRWTESSGPQLLPLPPADNLRKINESWTYDISADGSQVLGGAITATWNHACVWTDSADPVALPGEGGAYAMSDAGNVIVGVSPSGPACWIDGAGPVDLPLLPDSNEGLALGVSADGGVIVGYNRGTGDQLAVRWTEVDGVLDLRQGNPAFGGGSAYAVAADGATIVGVVSSRGVSPFRWTSDAGMVELSRPAGYSNATPSAVSGDGSLIVGSGLVSGGGLMGRALIWNRSGRCRELAEFLRGIGASQADGWQLHRARDISADGHTIVGVGRNPAGQYEHWIARIGPLCPGDVTADGMVDLSDIAALLSHLGIPADAVRTEGDLDDDGDVEIDDLMMVLSSFGSSCGH